MNSISCQFLREFAAKSARSCQFRLFALLLFVVGLPFVVAAQEATVVGTVTDPSGAVVPNVTQANQPARNERTKFVFSGELRAGREQRTSRLSNSDAQGGPNDPLSLADSGDAQDLKALDKMAHALGKGRG